MAEGLLFYLAEETIVAMLRARERARRECHRHTGLQSPALALCTRNGMPPPFGTDDPVALFTTGGWQLQHVTAPGGPDANYGRLPRQKAGSCQAEPT